jgi:hypothetical protein
LEEEDYFRPVYANTILKTGNLERMIKGKEAYLKKLTTNLIIPSLDVGKELEGSTPPSVFVGSWNYPKVYAGPMIAPLHGDTTILDMPESWIPEKKSQNEIIGYRLNLVRGKRQVMVDKLNDRFINKLQEIAMAFSSIESAALFGQEPKGMCFSDEHIPFGPSAPIERFDIDNVKLNHELEKVYYDDDLKASAAVTELHKKGLAFTGIQKAFSVGTMGTKMKRRLVPTRWSITACDSAIGNHLLKQVRGYDLIDCCRVHEFSSLNNYYAAILLPTTWQYEWMEAFLHILGREELIFSDYENNSGKRGYSSVGGCYYACKMAILEALWREQTQAGAIVIREAYRGYVPMGVFNVRENVRNAMLQPGIEFPDVKNAFKYISTKLCLPLKKFERESTLLREAVRTRQTTLASF